MGPAKSVSYDVSDVELGEESQIINLEFKAAGTEERDYIRGTLDQLSEQKISAIMQNDNNPNLKAACERIVDKHGEFPFKKEDYGSFIDEKLSITPAAGETKSDIHLLCDAWIKDMADQEEEVEYVEGFGE